MGSESFRPKPWHTACGLACAGALLWATPTLAEDRDCAIHDWLVWIEAEGSALDRAGDTPDLVRRALPLAQALGSTDPHTLGAEMTVAGLGEVFPAVATYLESRQDWLDALAAGTTLPTIANAAEMERLAWSLFCAADPGWQVADARLRAATDTIPWRFPAGSLGEVSFQTGARITAGAMALVLAAAMAGLAVLASAGSRLSQRFSRKTERRSCQMRAVLETSQGSYETVAVDISRSGAKLDLPDTLPRHGRCILALGGERLRGRIAWSNPHFVGVAFPRSLRQQVYDRMLAAHQWDAAEPAQAGGADTPENAERRPKDAVQKAV